MGTGTLLFTLALIEVAIYRRASSGELFVQPRVLARTAIVDRIVAECTMQSTYQPESHEPELEDVEASSGVQEFWQAFLDGLRLDDPEQATPHARRTRYVHFPFPWTGDA